ncbi:hypothetical protein M1E17_09180 [Arthrobacter sp. D1-29]
MSMSRETVRGLRRRRRLWIFAAIVVAGVAATFVLFGSPRPPSTRTTTVPIPPPLASATGRPSPSAPSVSTGSTTTPATEKTSAIEVPRTTNYRALATAAAEAIYSWDTRTSSYSEVYTRLRGWWDVLPDGSNPLAVFAQEFEATGINAGTFASLAGQGAFRTATAESMTCDEELAEVRQRPAPWLGMHVCTVSLRVVDQTASSRNAYTAPVSIMVNCPPAATAPPDRCMMVGFYATSSRIVY